MININSKLFSVYRYTSIHLKLSNNFYRHSQPIHYFSSKRKDQFHEESQLKRIIEETPNSYNSLTSYVYLFRKQLLGFIAVLSLGCSIIWFTNATGVYQDPIYQRRIWMPISQQKERQILGQIAANIFFKQHQCIQIVSEENIKSTINYSQQSIKLQNIQKYLKQATDKNYTIYLIKSKIPIIINLPAQKLIISTKLVEAFPQPQLQTLCKLSQILFVRRLHIRELSLKTSMNILIGRNQADPQYDIIIRDLYLRKYSEKEIQDTLFACQKIQKWKIEYKSIKRLLERIKLLSKFLRIEQSITSNLNYHFLKKFQLLNMIMPI